MKESSASSAVQRNRCRLANPHLRCSIVCFADGLVHTQTESSFANRLSEAYRYFVAHFAHVWLRHKKKKGNFPLQAGLLGMFPFFFFLSVCYILKIARAASSLPASWRRFSDETSRLFIVSLMPCAEFIVLVVEASFCSEIDARLCTTS